MNGKRLLVLYIGLAVASAVSMVGVYAQRSEAHAVPAFSYDVEFFELDDKGVKRHTHTDHYGVRSDGSTVMVDDSLLARAGERRVSVRDFATRRAWVTSLLGRT